jgi:hypothetical protein
MRPTLLKPGMVVDVNGRRMTFLRREKPYCGRGALSWFQCDAYRGINGPNDDGKCTMTDHYVVKNVKPTAKGVGG